MSGSAPAAAIAIRTDYSDAQPPPSPMSDHSEHSDDGQQRPATADSQSKLQVSTISPVSNERSTSNAPNSFAALAPPQPSAAQPPVKSETSNGTAGLSPTAAMNGSTSASSPQSAQPAHPQRSPTTSVQDLQHRSNLRNLLLDEMIDRPRPAPYSANYPPYQPPALRTSASPPHVGLHTPAASNQEEISPTHSDPSAAAAQANQSMEGTSPAGTRPKKTSCDRCHTRKIRCDHQKPSCSTCLQRKVPCVYSASAPKGSRGPPKTQVPLAQRPHHLAIQPHGHSPISPSHHLAPHSYGGSLSAGAEPTRPKWTSIPTVSDRTTSGNLTYAAMLDHDRKLRALGGFDDDADDALLRQRLERHLPVDPARRDSKEVDELESETDGPTAKRKADDFSMEIDADGRPKRKHPRILPEGLSSTRPIQRDMHDLATSTNSSEGGGEFNEQNRPSQYHSYADPLLVLKQNLPPASISTILFSAVFTDPFMCEGISMLIPHFTDEYNKLTSRESIHMGEATTLALAFTILAAGYAILPAEISEVILPVRANKTYPRSLAQTLAPTSRLQDNATMDLKWFDNALLASQVSEQHESLSVLLVVLKLMQFRYLSIRKGNWTTYAGGFLAQAIKLAQTLGMSKEWDGIPAIERELRRRLMWALYVTDRQHSLDTLDPYTIIDAHQGIHLPSPMTEAELYRLPSDVKSLPAVETESGPTANTALFIHVHLARRLTALLDSFCTIGPSNTPSEMLLRLDQSLEGFYNMLPPYLRPFPQTDTSHDSAHPYLVPHRQRLHVTLLSIRLSLYRAHLSQYLRSTSARSIRSTVAQICQGALRTQRSARMVDSKIAPRLFSKVIVFEATMTLALIIYAENAIDGHYKESSAYERNYERVIEGLEILDVTAPASAVKAVRAVLTKSDEAARLQLTSPVSPIADKGLSPSADADRSPVPARSHRADRWLDTLAKEGVTVEMHMKDASWEDGWARIVHAM